MMARRTIRMLLRKGIGFPKKALFFSQQIMPMMTSKAFKKMTTEQKSESRDFEDARIIPDSGQVSPIFSVPKVELNYIIGNSVK